MAVKFRTILALTIDCWYGFCGVIVQSRAGVSPASRTLDGTRILRKIEHGCVRGTIALTAVATYSPPFLAAKIVRKLTAVNTQWRGAIGRTCSGGAIAEPSWMIVHSRRD
jgi:hypothetical protein